VQNISQSLTLEGNGNRFTANFSNLQTAQNLTFRDCASISIPSLVSVTGSLGFYDNSVSSLTVPKLKDVGGTLAAITNNDLTNISIPLLKSIGGSLQIQNNSQLTEFSLPSLQTVGGDTDMYGNFSR
jgi:hypothetical protein